MWECVQRYPNVPPVTIKTSPNVAVKIDGGVQHLFIACHLPCQAQKRRAAEASYATYLPGRGARSRAIAYSRANIGPIPSAVPSSNNPPASHSSEHSLIPGRWVPLLLGALICCVMLVWRG